jgi:acetolactate synthase I/II/III large subunit
MKASDFIALFLEKKGIKNVFELSGGMITHLLDSLNQKTKINIITMHHEQATSFAADAYGRVSGFPGVALATSGPGATNLLTGIGNAYFDSVPCVFITGQVNRHEQKKNKKIRQLGFQETDIVAMAKPITKECFLVNDPNDIHEIFENAFEIATSGRPGPVLIDIPMDVQRADIIPTILPSKEKVPLFVDDMDLEKLIKAIKSASKPLILVGRGIRAGGCKSIFDKFLKNTQIPVITTLLGLDVISHDNPLRTGFIGSYGNRWANIAFGDSDLVIVLGSRLDIRQTGADTKFIENRKIFHVDCIKAEINNRVKGCIAIHSDLKYFFNKFDEYVKKNSIKFELPTLWLKEINILRLKWSDTKELNPIGINPNLFVKQLSNASNKVFAYTADVGSHQMWAAQSLNLKSNQLFLTSGGMGAMGYSLPAGIGASIANHKKPVVVIVGDGSMQLNVQELQTIVRNKLPIKIVVMNNQSLGMIRQFQESYFESRYQSTYWGYDAPDFEKISVAYGIEAMTINTTEQVEEGLNWLWENEKEPNLLQVMIDPDTNTYPKIAFGRPINQMEPFVKPIEMEGT